MWMWHTQVGAIQSHRVREPDIVSHDACWHRQNLSTHLFVVVANGPVHRNGMLAYLLIGLPRSGIECWAGAVRFGFGLSVGSKLVRHWYSSNRKATRTASLLYL